MTKKEVSQVIVNRTLPHGDNPACVFHCNEKHIQYYCNERARNSHRALR